MHRMYSVKRLLIPRHLAAANLVLMVVGLSAGVHAQESQSSKVATATPPLASAATRDIQLNLGLQFDDNVTRAGDSSVALNDQIYSFDLSKRLIFSVSENTRARLTFNLGANHFRRFDGLSHLVEGVQGELQYRASAAFGAPTFAIFASVSAEQFSSKLRDNYRYAVGLSVQQALTDRISYFGALSHQHRDAQNAVFTNTDNSARLNLDYAFNPNSTLYFGAEYRRGDIVTTTTPAAENARIATALVLDDDAFPGKGLTSYRFDGQSVLTTIGYNVSLNAHSAVDFSWRRIRSFPDLGATLTTISSNYVANQFSIVYLVRF